MEITIEDAIESLENMKSLLGANHFAINMAIDTMRKYQKICKILDKSDNGEQCMYDTIEEIEEVRDGDAD